MPKLISVIVAGLTTAFILLLFIMLPVLLGSYIGGAAVSQAQAEAATYHVAIGAGVLCSFLFIIIFPPVYQSAIDSFGE